MLVIGGEKMQPEFVERDAFHVMGFQSRAPFEDDDFETIWRDYTAYHDAVSAGSRDGAHYGVCFGEGPGGPMEYLAGMAVEGVAEVPNGLTLREVPGGRFAVFGCTVATIHDTYEHIFHEWQPDPEHRIDASRPNFEQYPPNTTSSKCPVFIYVPIVG